MLPCKMPRDSSALTLLAVVAACAWPAPARAEGGNAALAESLFREGKRLSGERKFAEACPKFAESYKLDPGLGTLLNLAICHESEGKPATAWAEFSEASSRAKREGDNDRAQLANEHVRALEPKLAHVSIALAPGAAVPGLVINSMAESWRPPHWVCRLRSIRASTCSRRPRRAKRHRHKRSIHRRRRPP